MFNMSNEWISRFEAIADQIFRVNKKILPTLARLFLVSTFIDLSLRLIFNWSAYQMFVDHATSCGYILSCLFVLINIIGLSVGSILILLRIKPMIAFLLLLLVMILQTCVFFNNITYLFHVRNISLGGSLLLLLADSHHESRHIFAGLPTLSSERSKPKTYIQLSGRIMLLFMCLTLLGFDEEQFIIIEVIKNGIILILILAVTVGYKTKLAAILLAVYLLCFNFYVHTWWSKDGLNDHNMFKFFQALSLIGGLLMLVSVGPGGVSFDEHKKDW